MISAYIFLGVALLLIFLEFFLPGGILGIAGGLLLVVSIVIFSIHATSAWAVILYVVISVLFLGGLFKFALWRLKRGKGGIVLKDAQEGYTASQYDETLIGREGVAFSDLKPSGHVQIEGKRYQAISKTRYIVKGTQIIVLSGRGAYLIVKAKEKNGS